MSSTASGSGRRASPDEDDRTPPRLLAAALFFVALGAAGVWGLPRLGADTLHQLEVRRWDVSECEILGRRVVSYRGGLLHDVSSEDHTFRFDLREVETGRRFDALASPVPPVRPYPEEVPDHWVGDMPHTRTGCRVEPGGDRAYLRAGSPWDLVLAIFGTGMAGAFALVGVVGGVGTVWELVRRT